MPATSIAASPPALAPRPESAILEVTPGPRPKGPTILDEKNLDAVMAIVR